MTFAYCAVYLSIDAITRGQVGGSTPCPHHGPPGPPPPAPTKMYPSLSGGGFTGAPSPFSPDPLATYRWNASTIAAERMQQYTRKPVRYLSPWKPDPTIFQNADALLGNGTGSGGVGVMQVHGSGTIAADFGSECAGWLEFDSIDLGAHLASGSVSVFMCVPHCFIIYIHSFRAVLLFPPSPFELLNSLGSERASV